MGSPNPLDFVSDAVGMMTFGTFDVKKMRMYVPLSPGAFRNFGKQTLNFATGEMLRDKINAFGDSPIAKGLATVASGVVLTLGTAGVASSLMAPAAAAGGGTGAITGTGGAVAPLAAGGSAVAPVAAGGTGVGTAAIGGLGATVVSKAPGMVGSAATGVQASPDFTKEIASNAGNLNNQTTQGWFSSLSPGAQTALITSGLTVAQMATGAMGGIFQGQSAQKKLELEQLINRQSQDQIHLRNKNNTYAPLVQFKPQPGMAAPTQGV